MSHPLDNPIWHALGGPQFRLGATDGQIRHFDPTIAMAAAVENPFTADFAGLPKGRSYGFITTAPVAFPAGIEVERQLEVLQMVAEAPTPAVPGDNVVALGDANVPAMMELVELTHPGPFMPRTIKTGRYWGIVADGKLVAMAGERMRLQGYTDVATVCTHPDYRGRGYARDVVSKVMLGIMARGETPFLGVVPDNKPAVAVYERLGFTPRRQMFFTVIHRR